MVAGRYHEQVLRWLADRGDDAPEWQEAAQFGDVVLYVTAEELQELGRELDALVEPLLARQQQPGAPARGRAPGDRSSGLAFPTGE